MSLLQMSQLTPPSQWETAYGAAVQNTIASNLGHKTCSWFHILPMTSTTYYPVSSSLWTPLSSSSLILITLFISSEYSFSTTIFLWGFMNSKILKVLKNLFAMTPSSFSTLSSCVTSTKCEIVMVN